MTKLQEVASKENTENGDYVSSNFALSIVLIMCLR